MHIFFPIDQVIVSMVTEIEKYLQIIDYVLTFDFIVVCFIFRRIIKFILLSQEDTGDVMRETPSYLFADETFPYSFYEWDFSKEFSCFL